MATQIGRIDLTNKGLKPKTEDLYLRDIVEPCPMLTPKDILISTLGQSPKTVTEVLGELLRRGTPIHEVLMIRTQGSKTVPPEIRLLVADRIPPDAWRDIPISGQDVLTPEEARQIARTIFATVHAQRSRADVRHLHLDLTGGRKTMSAYLMTAAQLLCQEGDRLYHAEVDQAAFQDKWYPTRGGEVNLLEVPFVHLAPLVGVLRDDIGIPFDPVDPAQLIAQSSEKLQSLLFLAVLARTVGHELSGDLNIIQGELEQWAIQGADQQGQRIIKRRFRNISAILQSILAVGQPDRCRMNESAGLRDTIALALADLEEKYDLPDYTLEGPPLKVICNPLLLQRMFRILIQNGLEAEATHLTFRLAQEGQMGRVEVNDNGRGMPEAVLERLFHLFKEHHSRPGRGVGLAIVRHLVSHYGGSVQVDSTEGKGTQVVLRLPLARSENHDR